MSKCHFSAVGPGNWRNLLSEFRPTRARKRSFGKSPRCYLSLEREQNEGGEEAIHNGQTSNCYGVVASA
jgi:hypothetical protein